MVRESELQYWKDVSVDFMTDESDDVRRMQIALWNTSAQQV